MSSSPRDAATTGRIQLRSTSGRRLMVQQLTHGQELEVISFLNARPLHTVFMRGFINDNGLESALNRGTFYGCRDSDGQLQGVALIGHATLFETRNAAAIQAFGYEARRHADIHMIMGEQHAIETFWLSLAKGWQEPRRTCNELLFEQRSSKGDYEGKRALRLAAMDDLSRVMSIQSEMALAESGVDPMEVDPAGFQQRYMRRIEQGRVWVRVEKETLMFKADVMFETSDVIYLEGIYVDPRHRGNGYGLSCLAQLSAELMTSAKSLCLLVNAQRREVQEFYIRAGFTLCSSFSTIFLERTSSRVSNSTHGRSRNPLTASRGGK